MVTGAAGFIGSHLCDRLLADGWQVVGLDDLSAGTMENLSEAKKNPNFSFVQADINKPEDLQKIKLQNIDCVFHHAGKKMVWSVKFPREDLLTNAYGTLNMLLWSSQNKAQRFILASTVAVYGEPKTPPSKEDSPIAPTNPYGISKYTCEEYCRLWHCIQGLPVVTFRYASVYGPRQALNVGVVNAFIDKIRNNQPLTVFGDGESTRPFTFVDDIVNANLLAADTQDPRVLGETFNVSSGESVSVNRLIEIISKKLGKTPKIVREKERVGEMKHMACDIEKIKKTMGFKPRVLIAEGLGQTVDYYEAKRL